MNTAAKIVSLCLSCLLTVQTAPSFCSLPVSAETVQTAAADTGRSAEPDSGTVCGFAAADAPETEAAAETAAPVQTGREKITVSEPMNLTGDLTLDGDVTLEADLNLNGHTLTVNGDLTQTAGSLMMYHTASELRVNGDYVLEQDGILEMSISGYSGEAPLCSVSGSFTAAGKAGNQLCDGTIEIGGDFTQKDHADNFRPNGTVLHFAGSGEVHRITFAENSESYVYDIRQDPDVRISFTNGILMPVLRSSLTLEGDTVLSSDLQMNGCTLTVNGSFTHKAGRLIMEHRSSQLNVSGDYILTEDGELYLSVVGGDFEEPVISVTGSFTAANNAASTLRDGTLLIGEDFIQTGFSQNFTPTGTHLRFFGTEKIHDIRFADDTESYIYNIIQDPDIRIRFSKGVHLPVLHSDLTLDGDTVIASDLQLNAHTLTVDGNLTHSAGTVGLYSLKSALCVSGNYLLTENGMLDMQLVGGTFEEMDVSVSGDFTVSSAGRNRLNDGVITVGGDFIQTGGDNFTPDGTLLHFTGAETVHSLIFDDDTASYVYDIKPETDVRIRFPNGLFIPVLHSDITVEEDTVLRSNLNPNGHTLTVNGDLTHRGGTLIMDDLESRAEVNGSYYLTEDGILHMNCVGDLFEKPDLSVAKDFRVSNNNANTLSDGTIIIGGNFRQEGGAAGNNFAPGGTTVKFAGTDRIHDVYFETPASYMGRISQEDGVKIRFTNGIIIPVLYNDLILEGDTVLNCPLDLNGHTLTINGSLIHTDCSLTMDELSSVLRVNGDYLLSGYGSLYMNYLGDTYIDPHLYVNGNLTVENGGDNTLNDGTITVGGDLIQHNFLTDGTRNLRLNGTRLFFSGTGTHTVDSESADTVIPAVYLNAADALRLRGSMNGFADVQNADSMTSDRPDVLLPVKDGVFDAKGIGSANITVSSADAAMNMKVIVKRMNGMTLDGDYDGDGEITAADAALLFRFISEDGSLTPEQLRGITNGNPDLNDDEIVSLSDLRMLLQMPGA